VLDQVVDPVQTEAFVRAYQRDVGSVWRPRTLVIEADRIAYTWDRTSRDGSIATGADVCFLRSGLIAENWTIRDDGPPPELPDVTTVSGTRLNTDELLALTAKSRPWHRERTVDEYRQTVAGVWDDGARGGIAVLVVENGRIDRDWSMPGARKLLY
jgi:hypothetical protein